MVILPTGIPKPPRKVTPVYFTFTYEGTIDSLEETFELNLQDHPDFADEIEGRLPWTDQRVADLFTSQVSQHYGDLGGLLTDFDLINMQGATFKISMSPHGTQKGL